MTNSKDTQPQKQSRQFPFTDRRIERLKLPDELGNTKQLEFSDVQHFRGLKLIHSCLTGLKKFHHRYYDHNGKKKNYMIGSFPAVNVKLAHEIFNKNLALLAQGLDPVQERDKKSDEMTFKDFAENIYLPEVKIRKRSWKDDYNKLNKDMFKAFGDKPLIDISKADFAKYLKSLLPRIKPATINRHRALLHSLVNMAIDHDLIKVNNVSSIGKLPEVSKVGRCLTPPELKRLLKVLRSNKKRLPSLMIELNLATGMRKSECLQIKWQNVNYTDKLIKLEASTTKGNLEHNVPMSESVITILAELKKFMVVGNPYIFPGKGRSHLKTVRRAFENCMKSAEIENFRLHDCRHNFCSTLKRLGVDPQTIQRLLGHQSVAMTNLYIHADPSLQADPDLHAAAKLLSDQLLDVAV